MFRYLTWRCLAGMEIGRERRRNGSGARWTYEQPMKQCWHAGSGAARYSESDAIRDGVHRYGVLGGNLDTAAERSMHNGVPLC